MKTYLLLIFILLSGLSFGQSNGSSALDYSDLKYWAAHPEKDSPALAVPGKGEINQEELLDVDIFYIHPTSYTDKDRKGWNANINNSYLNEVTDTYVIKNQASIFNQIGQIYAPRYRQAHISAYGLPMGDKKQEIFDVAYDDVKSSFLHFIENYNDGKPFILASHSQGTTHGKRLMAEFIEKDDEIRDRMIVAYLVGMDVKYDEFEIVKPCDNPQETGCFTSWRTIRDNSEAPKYYPTGEQFVAINPLTWDTKKPIASREYHQGAILKRFNKIHYNKIDAEVKNGMLYVNRPKFPFSFLFKRKNYHILDYNLFYFNIQSNAKERALSFFGE